jgi:MFS family permease
MVLCGVISTYPITHGLQFLVESPKLECLEDAQWRTCSREEVCASKSIYRVASNPNWSEKLDVLCADPRNLGFALALGSLISLLLIPFSSGYRKPIYCIFLTISICAQGFLLASDSYTKEALIAIGLSWPGMTIVGINYVMEFYPESTKFRAMAVFSVINTILIWGIPLYFGLKGDWYGLEAAGLILAITSLCFIILLMPESLTVYHSQGKYQMVRTIMEGLLKING